MITLKNHLQAMWRVRLPQWAAWALPRKVVYFAAIRLWVNATTGPHSGVGATTVRLAEALKMWED